MNEEKISPLYRHIKMLGIGRGAISQAFLIDALRKCYREANIEYTNFVFTYFNRIICNRHLNQIQRSTYDDIPDSLLRDDNEIYVFENDPESNEFKLIEKRKDINGKCIDLTDKNEIRICNSKGVHLYYID